MANPKLPKVKGEEMNFFLIRRSDVIARRNLGLLTPGRYSIYDAAIPVIVEAVDVDKLGPTAVSLTDATKLYLYNIDTDTLTPFSGGGINGSGTANVITTWQDVDSLKNGTWAFEGNDIYPLIDGVNIGIDGTNRVGTIFMNGSIDYTDSLIFKEGGVETARLLAGGHFGINKADPGASLHVVGEDSSVDNFTAQFDDSNGNVLLHLNNAGHLGVGVEGQLFARVSIKGGFAYDLGITTDGTANGDGLLFKAEAGKARILANNNIPLIIEQNTSQITKFYNDGTNTFIGIGFNSNSNPSAFLGSDVNSIGYIQLTDTNDITKVQILPASGEATYFTGQSFFGIGLANPIAQFHVKGSGDTLATYTGRFQNSNGDYSLVVRNDLAVAVGIASFALEDLGLAALTVANRANFPQIFRLWSQGLATQMYVNNDGFTFHGTSNPDPNALSMQFTDNSNNANFRQQVSGETGFGWGIPTGEYFSIINKANQSVVFSVYPNAGIASLFNIQDNGRINMSSLPTSAAGLTAGHIWNNSGVLNII